MTLERDPDDELDHAIDDNERGLKDTIRVNPNEIVEIAVRFTTYAGRYMYHCHILEHEDRDMMRPFVTMPPTSCRSWHDSAPDTASPTGPTLMKASLARSTVPKSLAPARSSGESPRR